MELGFVPADKQSVYESRLLNELATLLIKPGMIPASNSDPKILIENLKIILYAILKLGEFNSSQQSKSQTDTPNIYDT
jgi:hypothetical protein